MIRQRAQYIRHFLYSRHLSDALLITAGILIPSVVFARYGHFEDGVLVSLGAMGVGVTDLPGPLKEKTLGMLVCNALIFVVAVISGLAGYSLYIESIEVVFLCFVFSMFTLYGNRAASIGTTALMVMIVTMYKHSADTSLFFNAGLLVLGGMWYTFLSFMFYWLMPYRQMQQVLGECILETTKSLKLKARLYDSSVDQQAGLNRLMLQQITTNEKQDDVRRLIFTSPWMRRESSHKGKYLHLLFTDLMDVYEQIVTTSYYDIIRSRFGKAGILPVIKTLLEKLAINLRNVGRAVQANSTPRAMLDVTDDFVLLKKRMDDLGRSYSESTFILKKALITFRGMDQKIRAMAELIENPSKADKTAPDNFQYSRFLTPRSFSPAQFRDNLSIKSSTFRFALRVALVAFAGFAITNMISGEGHSYWILFTIVFILKPAFSLSKQRNYQRIGGTILGGFLAFPLLIFVHHNTVLFIALMLFMIIAYSFMRINYLVFVIFMTAYVLLMFKFIGAGGIDIVEERVIDTLIGATITFFSIYFVFPNWEFKQTKIYVEEMISANKSYLEVLQSYFSGKDLSINEYKLARKRAFVGFANLAASYQRMISEPRSKQRSINEIQKFIIGSHQLSSMISANASAIFTGKLTAFRNTSGNLRYIAQAIGILDDALNVTSGVPSVASSAISDPMPEDGVIKSQMKLLREQAAEIRKATRLIFQKGGL